MRTAIAMFVVVTSALSQGAYVSGGNAFSAGSFYGRYDKDGRLGFTASYTLQGLVDFSFSRSSVSTNANTSNSLNEYFIKAYIRKEHRLFFTAALGYTYQQAQIDLWRGYRLDAVTKGIAFEGGVHFAATDDATRRVVVSLTYRYIEPTTELRTPTMVASDPGFKRSAMFDVAVIHYLGPLGLAIGPRIGLDFDLNNVFWGLHLSALIRH
jgi:hypothetical protein